MLLRRKWLVLGVFLAVCLVATPIIWLKVTPVYIAIATVRISPVLDKIVFASEKTGAIPFYQSYVNTQVAIIRSPALLERVLDQPEVRDTKWYRAGSGARVEALQGILEVLPRGNTELIDVSIQGSNSQDTTAIVNVIVAEYKKLNEETSKASDTTLFETLTRERDTLQMVINGLIETKFNISSTLGTTVPEELRSQLSVQLSTLEARRDELGRDLKMLMWQLGKLGATSRPASKPGDQPIYAQDTEWRNLDMRVQEAKHNLDVTRQNKVYGESHPVIQGLASTVKMQEDLLRKREQQLDEMWGKMLGQVASMPDGANSVPVMQHLAEKKKRELELLDEEVDRQRARVTQAGETAQEIARYEEEIAQKRELKEAIRQRLEVLEMEGKAPARVRVAAYATEHVKPDKDRRAVLTLLAVAAALGLGLGSGYLRAVMDKRIYEAGEVQSICQVPHLGTLPRLSKKSLPRELGGPVSGNGSMPAGPSSDKPYYTPQCGLMEHIRMIRTTLLERLAQEESRVVLVTSALPSTGKTSVALLLARSLAVVGRRVLLVEGDLRRPMLAERLGLTAQKGLLSLLTRTAEEHQVIISSGTVNLDVILAGSVPDELDPELLARGTFSECLRRWRERYDLILLDSPPVLPVADAQIMAGQVDGIILVVRMSHDRKTEAAEAYAQLTAAGGRVLGTVMIGQGGRNEGYQYGYYYGYAYRQKPGPPCRD